MLSAYYRYQSTREARVSIVTILPYVRLDLYETDWFQTLSSYKVT